MHGTGRLFSLSHQTISKVKAGIDHRASSRHGARFNANPVVIPIDVWKGILTQRFSCEVRVRKWKSRIELCLKRVYIPLLSKGQWTFQSGGVSTMRFALVLADPKCDIFTSDCVVFVMTSVIQRMHHSYDVFVCYILVDIFKSRP